MHIERREFITIMGATAVAAIVPDDASSQGKTQMYGLIGKMTAVAGKREALIAILLDGVGSMPGCLSYIIAKDPKDADALWITEVWDSEQSHKASLSLPAVKEAIQKGRPLIAGFSDGTITEPVGGYGLPISKSK